MPSLPTALASRLRSATHRSGTPLSARPSAGISAAGAGAAGNAPHAQVKVSIVLAVFDPPVHLLQQQLDAIAAQTHPNWECVVVDDGSTNPAIAAVLTGWASRDNTRTLVQRNSNGGIAAATNDGLDQVEGDIVTICDHDDLIAPDALAEIVDHFQQHPANDVVYTDEEIIDFDGNHLAVFDKPDYSPQRHLGQHYLAHLVAARRSAIGKLRVRPEFEPAQDYDFYLRVIEEAEARGSSVGHIARNLYGWRAILGSSALDAGEKPEMAAAVQRCAQAALDRRGIDATARTVIHNGSATTSVVLDHRSSVAISIAMIEIGPTTKADELNALVSETSAAVVSFVPDTSRYDTSWAHQLATEALRPGIGAVGPQIVATDDTLLSVGRVVCPQLDDAFAGTAATDPGPWGSFLVAREVSALAPVGLTLRSAAFIDAGGLTTDIGLDAAFAELCVKLSTSGQATLWTPAAQLVAQSGPLIAEPEQVDNDLAVAATRTPAVRVERLATTGTAPLRNYAADAYTAARRLIASGLIDLVTCDVFDTLVTRPTVAPRDIFIGLGRRLQDADVLDGVVSPLLFAQSRVDAEQRARRAIAAAARFADSELPSDEIDRLTQVSAPECTLQEIWSMMPIEWFTGATVAELVEHELTHEAEHLTVIPEGVAVLEIAHSRDIPTHLVSDIYLSADQLRQVLTACGLDLNVVDEITTSADHRLGKADGLLQQVIEQHTTNADRVLHLGDNPLADVRTAERLGAQPVEVDVPEAKLHVSFPSRALTEFSQLHGTDGGVTAAVRSTLVAAGSLGLDPSFQFGAAVAGPALAGFSRWVSVTAEDLGASVVHCMLREGATIAELMGITTPDGPRPTLLHVSRWVTMRAAVIAGSPDELVTALARRANLTPSHVTNAFGCSEPLVRSILQSDEVPASQLTQACEALAANDEIRSTIVAASTALRKGVARYLERNLILDDGPLVLADVGWGGTIQEGLERILRTEGIVADTVGLYFALSAPGEERVMRGASMLSYLPNSTTDPVAAEDSRIVSHHADTIERVMTPRLGTLVDITEEGEPVCLADDADPIPPSLHTAQAAIRVVTKGLVESAIGINDDVWVNDEAFRAALGRTMADLIELPTAPMAHALGGWPHDDVAGTHYQVSGGEDLTIAVRHMNGRDIDMIDRADSTWSTGLTAQHNPSLAAQLAASRAGIALDALCPPSENGLARLAAFPIGSDLAGVQIGRHVAVSPGGWSVLRMRGPIESIRSLRFDAGEHQAIVDVELLVVRLETPSGHHRIVVDNFRTAELQWVDSHPIDRRRFVHQPGGHLLVPVDPSIGELCRSIEATVVFRCWEIDDESSLASAPALHIARTAARRATSAAARHLPSKQ